MAGPSDGEKSRISFTFDHLRVCQHQGIDVPALDEHPSEEVGDDQWDYVARQLARRAQLNDGFGE